jgi:hypothetical protein
MSDSKNQDKNKDKPKEELKPPTRLKIKLKTNVPGFGEINYNPAKMTLTKAGEDDSNIFFNPLIKLSTAAVNRAPESIRQLQFCNKGYFASLINSLNQTPAKNLVDATNKGYIRNNIDITLRTLFPSESVIKLGGKKYTIAAVDSDSDEWHIDVKVRLEDIINRDRITDPRLAAYATASADQELAALKRAGIAAGIGFQSSVPAKPIAPVPVKPVAAKSDIGLGITTPEPRQPLAITDEITPKPQLAITDEKPLAITDKPITDEIAPKVAPEVEEVEDVTPLLLQEGKPQAIELKKVPMAGRNLRILDPNGPATARFRETVKQLYNMVNSIYVHSGQNYRNKLAPPGTNNAISPTRWADSVNSLSVKQTITDGNCFFDAISSAINQYNSKLPDNNLTETIYIRESDIADKNSNVIYGITNDFTVDSLRTVVYRYIVNNGPIKEQMFAVSTAAADDANNELARKWRVAAPLNYIEYANWVRDEQSRRAGDHIIYMASPPFNREQITTLAGQTDTDKALEDEFTRGYAANPNRYQRPFVGLDDRRLQGYIESTNYWADTVAIRAMAEMLNICAIPIRVLTQNTVASQKETWDEYNSADPKPQAAPNLIPLISIPIELDNYVVDQVRTPRPNKIRSVKYIFLSETGSHYDLLIFGGTFAFNTTNMIDAIPLYIKMVMFGALFAKNFISDRPVPEWVPLQEDMYNMLISVLVILNRESDVPTPFCIPLDTNFSSNSLLMRARGQSMCARLQNAFVEKSNATKKLPLADPLRKQIEFFGGMYNETLREVTERFNNGNVPASFKPKAKKGQPVVTNRPVTRNKPEEPKVGGQYQPQYPQQYPSQYQPQYQQQMLMPGRDMRDLFKRDSESSLAYYITIYMYLYPGTNPPPGKLRSLKCAARRFKISQVMSKMVGTAPPSIMPEYSYSRPELFGNDKGKETRKGGRATHKNKRRTRRHFANKRETRKRGKNMGRQVTRRRK